MFELENIISNAIDFVFRKSLLSYWYLKLPIQTCLVLLNNCTFSFAVSFNQPIFRKYEEWACGILTRCQENPGKCEPADLLLRVVPNWGNVTCLTLAESAENLTFLSHPVVTDLLGDKWHGLVIGNNLIPNGYFGRVLAPTVVNQIYSYSKGYYGGISAFSKVKKIKGGRMGRSDTVSLWCVSLLINTRFHFFILEQAIVKRISCYIKTKSFQMTKGAYQVIKILPIKCKMAAAKKGCILRFLYLTESSLRFTNDCKFGISVSTYK